MPRFVTSLIFLSAMSGVCLLFAPPAGATEPTPSTVPPAAASPALVPLAQLMDARAGEAFVGEVVTFDAMYAGTYPMVATSDQIEIPRKYRKLYTRVTVGTLTGAAMLNVLVPNDDMGPLYSMTVGTPIRISGTLEHMQSPAMIQPTGLNRLLLVSNIEVTAPKAPPQESAPTPAGGQ